jgi:hypothetical protein
VPGCFEVFSKADLRIDVRVDMVAGSMAGKRSPIDDRIEIKKENSHALDRNQGK